MVKHLRITVEGKGLWVVAGVTEGQHLLSEPERRRDGTPVRPGPERTYGVGARSGRRPRAWPLIAAAFHSRRWPKGGHDLLDQISVIS